MAESMANESSASCDDYFYGAAGGPMLPPYCFSGVTARIFPLRADLSKLRRFCDGYVNVFPDVAEFRPLDGFVELVVLDYPSITSVEQPAFATYGQTEVFFLVPVLWKDLQSRQTRLAALTPYIFVDNHLSARIGRDLFGWPKQAAWYHRSEVASGSAGGRLAIDKEILDGRGGTTARLLEIERTGAEDRFSIGRRAGAPTASLDLDGVLSFASRPLRAARRLLALGHRGVRGAMSQWRSPTEVLNVNLKQIPQLEQGGGASACYQALTVTRFRATRLNGIGLLGERRQLIGDPSGGFVVRLFEDPTWPVVTQLGLSCDHSSLGLSPPGRVSYEFAPVFPFWIATDFEQQTSTIVASRGTPAKGGSEVARVPMVSVLGSRSLHGTAGTMCLDGVRVHTFTLPADARAQAQFVAALNAVEMDYCFELPRPSEGAPPATVVVAVISIARLRTERTSLLDWPETLVEIYLPLSFRRRAAPVDAGLPALFAHTGFTSSSTLCNAIHDSLGGEVRLAAITRGAEAVGVQGADSELQILRLSTAVVGHVQLGEAAREAPVLDLYGRPRTRPAPPLPPSGPAPLSSVPLLRLKQLPSAEEPRKSSYQALVRSSVSHAHGMRGDSGLDHELRLYDYDTLGFIDQLGLRGSDGLLPSRSGERSLRLRPVEEALYALDREVTLSSEVLWERLSR